MSMYILVNRDMTVELADEASGIKRFKKQICKFGEYVNPNGGGKMKLDRKLAEEMKANFDSGAYKKPAPNFSETAVKVRMTLPHGYIILLFIRFCNFCRIHGTTQHIINEPR